MATDVESEPMLQEEASIIHHVLTQMSRYQVSTFWALTFYGAEADFWKTRAVGGCDFGLMPWTVAVRGGCLMG